MILKETRRRCFLQFYISESREKVLITNKCYLKKNFLCCERMYIYFFEILILLHDIEVPRNAR